ncbi:MAG TPA: glycosyltransferase family 39 protein [Leptolyngbyaceae cyanobacterium]
MRKYLLKNNHFTWRRILLIILLVLGVFFRLVNLERKVYWYDEGFTSLRVGGYTIPEVVQQSFNGQVISVVDFRDRYLSPNSGRGFYGTLKSLAVEDPQHPPLYYLLTHLWMQWFGNSVAAIRSLPALISLLVFPCAYWLCIELFKSSLTAWVAMAIIAVSPFHVLFAQEAREYSLWTVTILLTSATLLRAMRLKTVYSWGIYALTLAISLYTFLFSIFIAIGHGIYLINSTRSKIVIAYLRATFIGFIAFIPWILVVINSHKRLNDSTSWMTNTAISLLQLANLWVKNIGGIFFKSNKFDLLLLTFIIVFIAYSFYFVFRHNDKTVWLFILTLFGATALALFVPDIIFGGQRSIQARFLIPCYLSIQLAVSHLIATKFSFKGVAKWQQKFWLIVTLAIFTGGVISSAIYSQSEVPWNKLKNSRDYKIARAINQASNPLVVVSNYPSNDNNVSYLFSFTHLLDAKVKLQLVDGNNIPSIPDGFSHIFIYNPCIISTEKQGLANEFKLLLFELKQKQNYQAEPVKISQPVLLWRLEKTSVNT